MPASLGLSLPYRAVPSPSPLLLLLALPAKEINFIIIK